MAAAAPAARQVPDSLARHISPETRWFHVPGSVSLESGARLDEVIVAYRTWGSPRNAHRAILVCHALTGSADVEAWWPGMIGEGGAFDPQRDYVICSNILGGCYGTTGPASLRPGSSSRRYRADFPRVSVRDMVNVQRLLLDHLGVDRLALVTGPSLGGMQALEWALMYPGRVASIVPIGVGGRHSAWCIGMSEAQRAAIYADPNWNGGYYEDDSPPEQGLAAARMMAILSYRSWHAFEQRFGRRQREDGDFEMQSYLRYQGEKLNRRFDAVSYVRLTQAMNGHDVASGRGSYHAVIAGIHQPALVVSVASDVLYPPHEQQVLARHLPNARYEVLDSYDGHDGFLVEPVQLGRMIGRFRRALEDGKLRRGASGAAATAGAGVE